VINLSDVSMERKEVFMTLMNAAIKVKQMEYDKEYFSNLCKGAWETVALNDPDDLFILLQESMAEDLSLMYDD
jgi:hypothetical protein